MTHIYIYIYVANCSYLEYPLTHLQHLSLTVRNPVPPGLRAAVMRSQGTYEDLLSQADSHRDALSGTAVRRLRSRAMDPAQKVPMGNRENG